MKRLVICLMMIGVFSGCNWTDDWFREEAKEDAYKRWYHARAKVLREVAVEHLRVGQLDRARSKSQEALALDPEFLGARVLLGKIYIEQGHYGLALRELQIAVEKVPESDQFIYLLGVAQEKNKQLNDALTSYQRAYALNNQNISAVKASAEVLVAMGRIPEAHLQLERYLRPGTDDPGVYELAGRLATMQGRHQSAANYFAHASALDYKNIRYREVLGRAQFAAGNHARAVETLKELIASPDYTPGSWVYAMLGDSYLATNRSFPARDAYVRASEKDPTSPGTWTNLSKVALALNDAPRAILSSRHALSLETGNLEATLLLGYALLRNGQTHDALAFLKQAASQRPDNGTLLCLLGRAFSATGNEAEAARRYVAALKFEPDNALAQGLLGGRIRE